MKDSGVKWLGEVPAHWGVSRLRDMAEMRVSNVDKHSRKNETDVRLCNYVDVYKNDRITPDCRSCARPPLRARSSVLACDREMC